jgi:hypothetical protein
MPVRKASRLNINATSSITNPGPGGLTPPVINNVIYTDSNYASLDDTAISLSGGYVRIIGSGFGTGFSLYLNGIQVTPSNTTYISANEVRALLPASSLGTYALMLFNGNNSGSVLPNGVFYSPFPTYGLPIAISTLVGISFSQQLGASGDNPLVYSIVSGTLPTGVTLSSSGLLSGTPTGYTTGQIFNFTIQVNDAQIQTITQDISLTVQVSDPQFAYTTLLLNGETSVTPFISDSSTNNLALTIVGDTRANKFSPYYGDGYYSNYFDGNGDYLTAPSTSITIGTGDFTVEGWFYFTGTDGTRYDLFANFSGFLLYRFSDNNLSFYTDASGTNKITVSGFTSANYGNRWIHIAITRQSGNTKLFINGTQAGSTFTSDTTNYTGTTFYLARNGSSAIYYLGYISNFRVVTGTALYTGVFTPPTTPLTAVANTSLLTCQSNILIDKSTNNFTITKNGDVSVSPAIPFTANSSYSTYGSAYFDGTGDYLSLSSAIVPATGNFTIEFWIYSLTNAGSAQRAVYAQYSGGTSGRFMFGLDQTSASRIWLHYNGTDYVGTTNGILPNTWAHLALVRNGDVFNMYVNGVLNATNTFAGASLQQIAGNIGGMGGSFNVNAQVSNLRIVIGTAVYTTTFTPPTEPLTAITNTQLLTLQFNGGANNSGFIDNSNFNNIITRNGNTSQGSFSPYSVTGWSNYFDGGANRLSVATGTVTIGTSTDYTIEAWVYVTGTTGDIQCISTGQNNGVGFIITNSLQLQWNKVNIGGGNISTGTLSLNQWTHVALCRASGTVRFWINGVLAGANADTTSFSSTSTQISGSGNAFHFKGYISNFRQVVGTALYTSAFTPPTAPLTPITNTVTLCCQSNRFVDNSVTNAAITINAGTPSVQAFSPFGSIREATPISYSNYFAGGASDYLTVTTGASQLNLPGDFTVELWFFETNSTPLIPQFVSGTTGGFACGINAFDGNATRKLDWRVRGSAPIYGVTAITTNTWHHAAYVKSGSTFRIFLNGVLEYYNGSYASTFTSTATYIGSQNSGDATYSFRGYISNLCVVKGTAVYTTSSTTIGATIFTPSTTPLTTITNTALLTCQSTTILDNSNNALPITGTGTYGVNRFNPFGYTQQSAASYTPSLHGGSAYFDGTGDYLVAPIGSTIYGTMAYTIEFWIYQTAATTTRLFETGTGTTDFSMDIGNTGFITINNNTTIAGSSTTISLSPNAWNHVALVRTSTGATDTRWYINGVAAGAFTHSVNIITGVIMQIGRSGAGTLLLSGYLSDLRIVQGTAIYKSSFVPPTQTLTSPTSTPASLLLNFTNGGIIDQHSTNVLETVGNTQLSTSVKKYNNASIYFDGTGDYLLTSFSPSFVFSGNLTIECWVYMNTLPTTGSQKYIIASWDAGANKRSFYCIMQESSGYKLTLGLSSDGSSANAASTMLTWPSPQINTWYHLAWVRNNNTVSIYVDGVSLGSGTLAISSYGSGSAVSIGADYPGLTAAFYWNGYIDDLRITKGYARYTSNFTAPTSQLITR